MEKFENEYALIFYDDDLDAISLNFKKKAPLEDFILINQKVLDIFKTLNTNKFYVDTRLIGVVALEGQKWVVENLFPGMIRHLNNDNLYHVQVINPAEIFGKVAVTNIKVKAVEQNKDQKLIIESFDSEEAAKAWLKSK